MRKGVRRAQGQRVETFQLIRPAGLCTTTPFIQEILQSSRIVDVDTYVSILAACCTGLLSPASSTGQSRNANKLSNHHLITGDDS